MNEHALPTFSMVIETENLGLIAADRLEDCLRYLDDQNLHPAKAEEVVLVDSGHAPKSLIARLEEAFPWVRVQRTEATYYEVKSIGLAVTTGEVVVFCDSDCRYEPEWLASMVTPFAKDPKLQVLVGQTTVAVTGPYTLATTLTWSFPPFCRTNHLSETTNYLANNVAFRREVLEDCPLPVDLPLYRGNCAIHSLQLGKAGYRIFLQPAARAVHPAPAQGIRTFAWRWMVHGRDMLVWFRLAEQSGLPVRSRLPLTCDMVTLLRILSEGTYKPLRRLPKALRDTMRSLFYLPLAGLLIVSATFFSLAGFTAALLDADWVLRTARRQLAKQGH